ncbi:uncharacterized protein BCR38DRAFT_331539, partial [Pseudomassariella vexata]
SSLIKISAFGKHSTSSTLDRLPLLKSPKQKRVPLLFDSIPNQDPVYYPHHQLPHRTSSAVLPLFEGESRRPRQIATGAGSYPFRPP